VDASAATIAIGISEATAATPAPVEERSGWLRLHGHGAGGEREGER
jgi:hypothetical protein